MASRPRADTETGLQVGKLFIFRTEVGIADVQPLNVKGGRRTAPNVGIYQRVVAAERSAKWKYYLFATSLNLCLLAQLILGAALTALGASNGSHTKITIIASANTVIAGILSFVKGSGMPNRFKQFRSAMRVVREYIEQKERDFGLPDCKFDVYHEIGTIMAMYQEARRNDEDNDPDSYRGPQDLSQSNKPATLQRNLTHPASAAQESSQRT